MKYMIAIDSGGTKTDTVLFNEKGAVLYRKVSLGANPLDVGEAVSLNRIMEAINEAASHSPERISAVYAAVAGVYYYYPVELFNDEWKSKLGADAVRVDDDGRCLISGEFPNDEDGCGLVCGTGCSIWVRKEGRAPLLHIGGWGYLFDAIGSGFSLGRNAVHAACRAYDGRGEKTVLVDLIEKDTGIDLRNGVTQLYAGGRRRIAALAYTVFEGVKAGDRVSKAIMNEGAEALAELIWAASKHFDGSFPVVLSGGIINTFPEYTELIHQLAPPQTIYIPAKMPPVYGGAVEAMHDCNMQPDAEFKARFLSDYQKM